MVAHADKNDNAGPFSDEHAWDRLQKAIRLENTLENWKFFNLMWKITFSPRIYKAAEGWKYMFFGIILVIFN